MPGKSKKKQEEQQGKLSPQDIIDRLLERLNLTIEEDVEGKELRENVHSLQNLWRLLMRALDSVKGRDPENREEYLEFQWFQRGVDPFIQSWAGKVASFLTKKTIKKLTDDEKKAISELNQEEIEEFAENLAYEITQKVLESDYLKSIIVTYAEKHLHEEIRRKEETAQVINSLSERLKRGKFPIFLHQSLSSSLNEELSKLKGQELRKTLREILRKSLRRLVGGVL